MSNKLPPKWLQWCYLALFAALPWSVEWPVGKTWNLTVPAEPLIAVCGLGLIWAVLRDGKIKFAGLAWISFAWIAWQTVTTVFSTIPLVSWKYWLVETGQWLVFFGGLYWWPQWWPGLIRIFTISLGGVAVFTLIHHGFYYQFRADQAVLAPMPFFADHTIYSAVVVMVLLGFSGISALPSEVSRHGLVPIMINLRALPILFILTLCLVFSRAAWLSLFLTVFFGAALYFRKYRSWFLTALLLAIFAGFYFRENIGSRLSADVSSLERWNRYSCALRMANDRPWTGFGPGTYQFQYLPYQKPGEMTRLSINEPISRRESGNYGRGGGAHSEYLRALAETGWLGLMCWLLLVGSSLMAGIRLYLGSNKLVWLVLLLSLLSFFLHGLFNNFLHDSRVAALVWGQMAVLISTHHKKAKNNKE